MTNDHGRCPNCNADLNGRPIYEVMLEQTGGDEAKALEWAAGYGATKTEGRFGRVIGIEYPERYDGVWEWQCPDCEHVWPRFPDRAEL